MIMTPIKAFSGGEEASLQRPLLSPEGKSAAPGSHLSGGGGGEAESGTSVIAEGDLPGQFTRVMGKGELHAPASLEIDFMDSERFVFCFNLLFSIRASSVCTQLLVSRSDEENISSYLQLIDKCLIHEVTQNTFSKYVHTYLELSPPVNNSMCKCHYFFSLIMYFSSRNFHIL